MTTKRTGETYLEFRITQVEHDSSDDTRNLVEIITDFVETRNLKSAKELLELVQNFINNEISQEWRADSK